MHYRIWQRFFGCYAPMEGGGARWDDRAAFEHWKEDGVTMCWDPVVLMLSGFLVFTENVWSLQEQRGF